MRRRPYEIGFSALVLVVCVFTSASASVKAVKRHVEFLASEELAGRLTGTDGERRAADYIEERLKAIGALPLPSVDGYRYPFEFTSGTNDAGSTLTVGGLGDAEPTHWQGTDQVRALSFSDDGRLSGEVVFAGYGMKVPESQELSYDSYFGLDVKDKIVVVLRYWPEDVDDKMRIELTRYSGLRYKALMARENGARALLVVSGPNSPDAGKTVASRFDAALAGSGIVAASIGGVTAEAIFANVEGGLARAQTALDTGNPHVTGFEIPGLTLDLEVKCRLRKPDTERYQRRHCAPPRCRARSSAYAAGRAARRT